MVVIFLKNLRWNLLLEETWRDFQADQKLFFQTFKRRFWRPPKQYIKLKKDIMKIKEN